MDGYAMSGYGSLFRCLMCLVIPLMGACTLSAQQSFKDPSLHYRASVYGTLIYPGFNAGLELPSRVIQVYTHRKKRTHIVQKQRYWGAQIGFYTQPYVHNNYYAMATKAMRRVNTLNTYSEWVFGIGLSRTWLNGAVYSVDQQGEVNSLRWQGNWHGVFSSGWYYGWDKRAHVKPYFGFSQITFLGNNGMPHIRPTIDFGCRFKTGNARERSFKFEERHKGPGRKKEDKQN